MTQISIRQMQGAVTEFLSLKKEPSISIWKRLAKLCTDAQTGYCTVVLQVFSNKYEEENSSL